MKNPFKPGDPVRYKDEGPGADVFQVYAVYDDQQVSLGLRDYPDTEQDYLTHVDKLQKVTHNQKETKTNG